MQAPVGCSICTFRFDSLQVLRLQVSALSGCLACFSGCALRLLCDSRWGAGCVDSVQVCTRIAVAIRKSSRLACGAVGPPR